MNTYDYMESIGAVLVDVGEWVWFHTLWESLDGTDIQPVGYPDITHGGVYAEALDLHAQLTGGES